MINRLPKEFQIPTPNGKRRKAAPEASAGWSQRLASRTGKCIADHPLAALGAALLTGILLGRWVKS